jgi:hypothetical protein
MNEMGKFCHKIKGASLHGCWNACADYFCGSAPQRQMSHPVLAERRLDACFKWNACFKYA